MQITMTWYRSKVEGSWICNAPVICNHGPPTPGGIAGTLTFHPENPCYKPTLWGQTVGKTTAVCPRRLLYFTLHSCNPRYFCLKTKAPVPGAVARLEACWLGMQVALSSIPTSGTFFRGDLVMKTFLPLPLIEEEQLSVTGERMCTKYW